MATAQLTQTAESPKVKIATGEIEGEAMITVMNARGITDSVKVTVKKPGKQPPEAIATVPDGPFHIRSGTQSFPFFVYGGQAPYEVKLLPGPVPGLEIDLSQSQKGYFTIERDDNVTGGLYALLITDNGKPNKRFMKVKLEIGLSTSDLQHIRANLCVKGADDSKQRTRRAIREYQQAVAASPTGTLDAWQAKRVLELDPCPEPFQTYYEWRKLKEEGEVRDLQKDLNTARAGTLIALSEPLSLTGKLDKPTRNALKKLQIRYKVSPADGIYTQDAEEARTKIATDFPEAFLTATERLKIQRRLCVDDDGIFGSKTRRSIKEYQTLLAPPATGTLTQDQAQAVLQFPECPHPFMTYYEVRQLGGIGSIKEIQEKLNRANEKRLIVLSQPLELSDKLDEPTRDALRAFQRKMDLSPADGLWSKATRTMLWAEIP